MPILLILAACALAVLGGAAYSCRQVFWVRRSATLRTDVLPKGEQYEQKRQIMLDLIRSADAIAYEPVTIRSKDGLTLAGRYYEAAPGAPLQIQFHGYRSNCVRDFSGGLQLALKSGCNVLLVDQRAHGKSQGSLLSFGILERQDCVCWAEYAAARFGPDTPIFLVGISMGAATVLMASELPLPETVAGIISDCGYSSPRAIIRKVMAEMKVPVAPVYPLIRLGGMLFGHFDIEAASASEALKHCRKPVLFIHGEDDRFVPCSMTLENHAACASEKYLLTVPGAGHGLSYMEDYDAYAGAVSDFLRRCLSGQKA